MNLLQHTNGRAAMAFLFYFAEGAPIGFIWWALPSLMRQHGASPDTIGSLSALLVLPWIFKFLWAPLIDVFRSDAFGFKKWIGLSQAGMCITLLPLIFIPLQGHITIWGILLFLHAICAATQDVSVDALVINTVPVADKGLLNGFMQAGMLLGRSLFGGGLLMMVDYAGIRLSVAMMILLILLVMLLLLFIKEPRVQITANRWADFTFNLSQAFRSRQTWRGIAFALTAAAAFEAAGAFAGPLLTDLHVPSSSIGFFFAVPVVIAMLVGGITGGMLSDKIGRRPSLVIFLVGFVLMAGTIAVAGLTAYPLSSTGWMALYTVMYFFTGMFTAASYAMFMDLTNPRLGATQFSTFMAATNGCESWVVYSAGLLAAAHSYYFAFGIMCIVSLASLIFLPRFRLQINKQ